MTMNWTNEAIELAAMFGRQMQSTFDDLVERETQHYERDIVTADDVSRVIEDVRSVGLFVPREE